MRAGATLPAVFSLNLPLSLGEGRGEGLMPSQTRVLVFSPEQIQTQKAVPCDLANSFRPLTPALFYREREERANTIINRAFCERETVAAGAPFSLTECADANMRARKGTRCSASR